MKKFHLERSQAFERTWYDRLDAIEYRDLQMIIDYNQAINQSKEYKYSRVVYFIILLTNKYHRHAIAMDLIKDYWSHLNKKLLINYLFRYGTWELFEYVFDKARLKDIGTIGTFILFTDDYMRVDKLIQKKKYLKNYLTLTMIKTLSRWERPDQPLDPEIVKRLNKIPFFAQTVLEHNFTTLYNDEMNDVFLL